MNFLLIGTVILIYVLIVTVSKIYKLRNIKYYRPEILADKKILTVYYSNNGNTKSIAQYINSIVGGDIKEIQLKEAIPNNIFKMSKLVRKQIKDDYLPKIDVIDIAKYDIVFVGTAIWNFSMSLPVKSFLNNNNFENKTLIPFFTYSGGANKSKIVKEYDKLTNSMNVIKPLFMFENGIILAKEQVINYLNKL